MFITINDFDPRDHEQVEALNILTGALLAGPRDEITAQPHVGEVARQIVAAVDETHGVGDIDADERSAAEEDRDHEAAAMAGVYDQGGELPQAGRTVSPYGFADPNREPGKPGEGRKRRTKAEMEEDERYEAQQRGQQVDPGPPAEADFTGQQPQSDIYRQHPHGTETGVSEADYAPPAAQSPFPPQQEQPPAQPAPPAAPPPGASPFNF